MSTVKSRPTLNVLGPTKSIEDDVQMRECSPETVRSRGGGGGGGGVGSPKNTLGLILPGSGSAGSPVASCAHFIDSMLTNNNRNDGSNQQQQDEEMTTISTTTTTTLHPPGSPQRRIILETTAVEKTQNNLLLKTPPLICEQGPSAPSSPTTPSPGARSAKRPCPLLSVDALQRINLLSPNYIPSSAQMDHSKLPPVSPSYPTSDLGSSPRSSISASHYSSLGINPANWSAFRDAYARRHGTGSGDADDASDCGAGVDKERHSSMLLSPHQLLSPTPFSPFSDYGVASASGTPYSNRSPNMSPSPCRRSSNLHFSFEQIIRSRSSLSNHPSSGNGGAHRDSIINNNSSSHHSHLAIPQPRSLDMEARERSRSEGEALAAGNEQSEHGEDERMDTSHGHGHSTLSMPTGGGGNLHAGQKRRLLTKSRRREEEEEEGERQRQQLCQGMARRDKQQQQLGTSATGGGGGGGICQQDSLSGCQDLPSASQMPSRQPTIEEPPPSPTLTELFQPGDLDKDRRRQVEDWIRQQTAALEAFRHSLIPPQQEANLLQVPSFLPQNSLEQLWPIPSGANSQAGPIRSPTLWRRSRSESDVSAATAAAAGGSGGHQIGRRQSGQHHRAPLLVPLNEATHVCEHCGQGFSMHDRLAKHIASRHRDRSASINDEGSRVHKCNLCPKSFGRSDMLTRHMRLHTGLKPYACQLCGQVFSRSDHLSTHQRTHTGEKPYRCPQCNYSASRRDMITRHMRTHLEGTGGSYCDLQIPPISELSLNPPSAPPAAPPPSVNASGAISPQDQSTPMGANSPTPPAQQQPLEMDGQHGQPQQQQPAEPTNSFTSIPPVPPPPAPNINEQLAKLLSAAVANGTAAGLFSQQIMLGSLGAQLPSHFRRSTPNLFAASTAAGCGGDYPSAFRPPPPPLPHPPCPPPPTTSTLSAMDPAMAAAAAVQQLMINQQQQQQQQQQFVQQRLSLPGGAAAAAQNALPYLFRQNSFGGLGFSHQQNSNPNDN